jgi:uncharacterized protein (TIGR03118 family)
MKTIRTPIVTNLLVLASMCLTITIARAASSTSSANNFSWVNLQSDIAGVAQRVDPNLVNPWGMALSSSNTIWVADNGAGVATVYNPDGSPVIVPFGNAIRLLVVTIPPSASNTEGANPTGIVANNTPFFKVTQSGNSLPSEFIFVSEDGSISGFNSSLDPINAILAVDNGATGAVYKGATMGTSNGHNFLYVTNFHAATVETYDENFALQSSASFPFTDPNLPAGYAPFGIRQFNGQVFVTYAKQNAEMHDDVAGPGNGFIDIFDTSGNLVKRLVSNGNLNSPWGLAMASGTLNPFQNDLLVGNFGDGRINVYNPSTGAFVGTPTEKDGTPLDFANLWDLLPLNNAIYFSAGIAHEQDGLFGVIQKAQSTSSKKH